MGKQLIFDALTGKQTERAPWLPFVGCHGGALIGKSAEEYLRSGELIAQGVREAIRQYRPDGIPVMFDLQIEAEALGCGLQWAQENPPAVVSHVLETQPLSTLSLLDENSGRIPEMLKAIRLLRADQHDVALYGLVTGPFTLALHLKGTKIFTDMFDSPEEVQALLAFCMKVAKNMARMYIDAGCDVIASVDPMTSQISPRAFKNFVLPYATELFEDIRRRNAFSSFFVCGHAQKNLEVMCQSGPDNVCVDENIPLDFVKDVAQKHGVSFGGNLQLTVVLLMGSEDDVRRHTLETLDLGGDSGYILAPGCDLPYRVPPANLCAVAELVHDSYQRDVARKLLEKQEEVKARLDLRDYGQAAKVVVDVITLDSEACAPCQYMVEAVRDVADYFGDLILWREHKIKEKEAVEFMLGLMVKNVPTICIDGEIRFVSVIPPKEELIKAIQERINQRFAMRLRQAHGRLLVLGSGAEAEQVWANVNQAAKELGSTVELLRVMDEHEIAEYGVPNTPAVLSVRERMKSVARVPSVEVVKEWIKELRG
ncbi:uroporphyrinogen decarboxylase superfamily [Candidatus Vecturithrix granuli]|uniref:Uroporphyrinogen decarboxylase superfamily n=1 Tax=Vecturithrix granuli TaxID=1499967 RepID=A0A081C8U9_VECG1|nr:uroporphyrinogen decarboxylase superfamily [Candidatus Vecturithrix granuli]